CHPGAEPPNPRDLPEDAARRPLADFAAGRDATRGPSPRTPAICRRMLLVGPWPTSTQAAMPPGGPSPADPAIGSSPELHQPRPTPDPAIEGWLLVNSPPAANAGATGGGRRGRRAGRRSRRS